MVKPDNCPSCGAPVQREFGKSAVCEYCGSFFRVPDSELKIIAEREKKEQARIRKAEEERRREAERRRKEESVEFRVVVQSTKKRSFKDILGYICAALFFATILVFFFSVLYSNAVGRISGVRLVAVLFYAFMICFVIYLAIP